MFSTVFKCRNQLTQEVFACKRFTRAKMSRISLNNLHEEIRILSSLPHNENIIRLHETIKTDNNFYLIVDYCNGGDMETFLDRKVVLKENEVQHIFTQVFKAMKVLREIHVIHRDIKNANILLNFPKDGPNFLSHNRNEHLVGVKLADFGFSMVLPTDEMASTQCGTPLNMAPEILNDKPYNYKVDMWSLGVTMFEALFGTTPFFGIDREDLTRNINVGLIRLPLDIKISDCCLDFLSKCLRYDYNVRISIDHALNHPFINPDSPQYMDKISARPIMKTFSNISTVNQSIRLKPS